MPSAPHFEHILPERVESIEFVQSIGQDAMGFMWFGGRNGLARYDGYDLKIYKANLNEPGSLQSSGINHVLLSSKGSIWFATDNGLHTYVPEFDNFDVYQPKPDAVVLLKVNEIYGVAEDANGLLWLATGEGLYSFDPATKKFERRYVHPNPAYAEISSVIIDREGMVWMGYKNGGLYRFNPKTTSFTAYLHNPNDPNTLSSNEIRGLYLDSEDNLWIGTFGGGTNRLSPDRKNFTHFFISTYLNRDDTWEIQEDPNGTIWVAMSGGLSYLNKTTDEFKTYTAADGEPHSLAKHDLRSLFIDKAGDIWVGFFPSGVDYLNPQASIFQNFHPIFHAPTAILGNGIRDTYLDENNDIWVATGFGLSHYDSKAKHFKNYTYDPTKPYGISNVSLLSVEGDSEGYIWMGVWASGLNRLDPRTGQIKHYIASKRPGALRGSQPWSMCFDHQGVLWIATDEGLNRYNRETDDFTYFRPKPEQIDGLKKLYSRTVYEDASNNLWLGSTRGLFLFDRETETFKRFQNDITNDKSLSANFVLSVFDDKKGSLWVGTKGGGVNRMDMKSQSFVAIDEQSGLPDDVVTGIIDEGEDKLWFSTQNGLVRYTPRNGDMEIYNRNHGLTGNLFNRETFSKTKEGFLIVGSVDGLTIFHPDELWKNDYVPPVVLTGLDILNKRVTPDSKNSPLTETMLTSKKITLNYHQSVVSFRFAALSYRSPERNQFKLMLEGFDTDWHTTTSRIATYTNLDAGTYTFHVKASNNDGVWNQAGRSIQVEVLPPPWLSWWAYCLYAIGAVILFVIIVKDLAARRVYHRESELNKSLINLDGLKDQFLANTSHELLTPLHGIINLSDMLIDGEGGDMPSADRVNYLKMINYSGTRLAKLVDDILDYSDIKANKLVLNKKDVALKPMVERVFDQARPMVEGKPVKLVDAIVDDFPKLHVDEKRFEHVLFNLISNAIKFTDEGAITVFAKSDSHGFHVSVSDTGIGIPPEQQSQIFLSFEQVEGKATRQSGGTGLGLTITKKLMALHGGDISVHSVVGQGSTFTLTLPKAV